MKKILVTGGAGFVGSNLTKKLLLQGHQVLVYDNLFTGKKEFLPNHKKLHFVLGDITDKENVTKTFEKFKPDLIYHLAAIHFIPYCSQNPAQTFNVNVTGTQNILDACSINNINKIIFASSAAVYPISKTAHRETDNTHINNVYGDVYGITKITNEFMLKHHSELNPNSTVIATRFFNVYGPNETNPHFIPSVLEQTQESDEIVIRSTLKPARDYVHVEDVTDALLALSKVQEKGFEIYNIGSGKPHTVGSVIDTISKVTKRKFQIISDPKTYRKNDRLNLFADISKIQKEIKWQPKYTLDKGISKLLNPGNKIITKNFYIMDNKVFKLKKLKIAHIAPFFKPTICGVGNVVYEIAKRQANDGHEVHVFTSDSDKHKRIPVKEEKIEGIHVHRTPYIFKISSLTYVWPQIFVRLLKQKKFDVIHTHSFNQAHIFFAGAAAKIKNIAMVHTTHGPWIAGKRPLLAQALVWPTQNIFSRQALKWIDGVIAITTWEIPFIKRFGGKKALIEYIPNGMAKEFGIPVKNNDFKQKHGIKDKKIVLFLGRLTKTKGPDILMRAAYDILEKRKDIAFVFAGGDEGLQNFLEEKAKKYPDSIKVPGRLSNQDMIKAYQACDVYALPTQREGVPLTMYEAMAAGAPIVITPISGIPYEVKEYENALFADYGDVKTLKEKILEIIDNKKLAKKLRENNLKKAIQYDWDKIEKKTLHFYYKILSIKALKQESKHKAYKELVH